jgi:hypothetical protein
MLPIGSRLKYGGRWARVSAVGNGHNLGERYYWITFDDGSIAMLPAASIELHGETKSRGLH